MTVNSACVFMLSGAKAAKPMNTMECSVRARSVSNGSATATLVLGSMAQGISSPGKRRADLRLPSQPRSSPERRGRPSVLRKWRNVWKQSQMCRTGTLPRPVSCIERREGCLLSNPSNPTKHYDGFAMRLWRRCHVSFLDRILYYCPAW